MTKWYVFVPCIIVSWGVAVALAITPYFPLFGIFNNNGFCDTNSQSVPLRSIILALFFMLILICFCVIIVFTILTYCYVNKNSLDGDAVKKGIAKNLLYFFFATILSFIFTFVPPILSIIRARFADNGLLVLILSNYIVRVILSLPSMATPIVTIVTLKPLRFALKQMFVKICCCKTTSTPQELPQEPPQSVPTAAMNAESQC